MATNIHFNDAKRLGELAMRFRGTRDSAQRQDIMRDYSRTVERLIDSGNWSEVPPPEDQLPDECMPPTFFEFWSAAHRTA